jgi:hypothetical protein
LAYGILLGMQTPLFVRPLTADERATLETSLRSSSAFTVRRCQILLASAAGQSTTTMARHLRCTDQTVRNALHAVHQRGLAPLQPQWTPRPRPRCRSCPPRRTILIRQPWPVMACWGGRGRRKQTTCGAGLSWGTLSGPSPAPCWRGAPLASRPKVSPPCCGSGTTPRGSAAQRCAAARDPPAQSAGSTGGRRRCALRGLPLAP